ncbi:MAG TPA: serine hydrolase [Gemmatimonadales bacterium]|nr:serine hydrolase [Gemmatimonadales bacterium]
MIRRLCLLTLFAAPLLAQKPAAPALPKDWDAYVTKAMQEFHVPGLALAIVKDGQVIYAKGYGVRRMGEPTPVDTHTLFQIASNTKAFTDAMIAQLVDSGRLSWDDPVTKYLPWFALSDPWVTREFTIRDLVTHRSGLGLGAGDLVWWHSDYSAEDVVRHLRAAKPVTSFRSGYAYDNVLYIAAGLVLESVTGKSWSQNLQERILNPLGMTETTSDIGAFTKSGADAATPHGWSNGSVGISPRDTINNTLPAGGIIADVADLSKWMMTQLDSGRYSSGRLWSARQAREMWSPQTILRIGTPPPDLAALRPNFAAYGLGWFLRDYRGRKLVEHTGGLTGMTSQTTLVPDERLGIVILTNGESAVFDALTWRLLDHFLGGPNTDWAKIESDRETHARAQGDSIVKAAQASRDSTSQPSLSLASYAGTYHDDLYGDATITQENGGLVFRFTHSPAFTGDLKHWQHDTFVARWRGRGIEDAYVTFTLNPDGTVDSFKMAAVSPLADFSFDYQDLLFHKK